MRRYRKRPVEIEACRWTGENFDEIRAWSGARHHGAWNVPILYIDTLEGLMTARVGDWIIRGVAGEFYPCKPDIFDATYELSSGGVSSA